MADLPECAHGTSRCTYQCVGKSRGHCKPDLEVHTPKIMQCPECGNEDKTLLPMSEPVEHWNGAKYLKCMKCHYQGPVGAPGPAILADFEAILAWNYNCIHVNATRSEQYWINRGALVPLDKRNPNAEYSRHHPGLDLEPPGDKTPGSEGS